MIGISKSHDDNQRVEGILKQQQQVEMMMTIIKNVDGNHLIQPILVLSLCSFYPSLMG